MNIMVDSQSVVVFDLDDTLYNEIDFLRSAYMEIARQLAPTSWQTVFSQMFAQFRNRENVFELLEKRFDIPVKTLIDQYRLHSPTIELFDGVAELFTAIEHRGGKIALISDGRSITQRNKLTSLGIENRLSKIVISEEIESEKPSLKNFQAIEDFFRLKHYTYVGDNLKKDFVAPNKLGWSTLCKLDRGLNIHNNAHRFITPEHLPGSYFNDYLNLHISPPKTA